MYMHKDRHDKDDGGNEAFVQFRLASLLTREVDRGGLLTPRTPPPAAGWGGGREPPHGQSCLLLPGVQGVSLLISLFGYYL